MIVTVAAEEVAVASIRVDVTVYPTVAVYDVVAGSNICRIHHVLASQSGPDSVETFGRHTPSP